MAEPCFNAKVLAATLLGSSETFAKEMINYSNELNTIKLLGGEKSAKQAEKLINEKIAIALDVRILRGEAGDQARIKLMKDLSNKGYTLKQAVDFFDKLENISLKDIDKYGSLLFREGEGFEDKTQAIEALKEAVATHIVTQTHLKRQYGVQKNMLRVTSDGKVEWTEDGEKLVQKIQSQIAWWNGRINETLKERRSNYKGKKKSKAEIDVEINKSPLPGTKGTIAEGKARLKELNERLAELTKLVEELVPIANRWTDAIKSIKNGDVDLEGKVNNYIVGSVFIGQTSDEEVMSVINKIRGKWGQGVKNYLPSLTVKDVEKISDLNSLMERIYQNALDIATNKEVRKALKDKLYKFMNDGNEGLLTPSMLYADSLMNTLLFCDTGDSFSDVLRYHRVGEIVSKYVSLEKGVNTYKRNKAIFNELKKLLDSDTFIKDIGTTDNPKVINFMGVDFTGEDFLRLIYAIAWDDNLSIVSRYGRNIPDADIFSYVRLKLFGSNVNKAESNITHLLQNFIKPYKYQDLTAMGFKVTSSIPITEEDFGRVTFVHFNNRVLKENQDLGEAYGARAKFNDALADINTLTVTSKGVPNNRIFDLSDGPVASFPTDTKYVVIPNGKYSSDEGFKNQIQTLRKSRQDRVKALRKEIAVKNKLGEDVTSLQQAINGYEEDIIIVYPKGKESGQYFIDPGTNRIKYKTTNSVFFNELSRDIAASTFNRATINLSENTNEIAEQLAKTTAEKEKDLNEKAFNFWRYFLGIEGEKLTNEQVLNKLSELTGIPFKADEMNTQRWTLAQDIAFHRYSTSSNYYTEIADPETIGKRIQEIREMPKELIERELESQGYRPDIVAIEKNLDSIREAMVGMETASTLADYLWFKGVKIGLATNIELKTFDLNQFKGVFKDKDPVGEVARLIFGDRTYTKNELLLAESYLGDLTDAIVDEFANNLLKAGYQLPLSSPKIAVLSYLTDKPFAGEKFTQDFLYKNGIADDEGIIAKLFDDNIPSRVELGSDITSDGIKKLAEERRTGNIRIQEISDKEKMLPLWYNSYWAAMGGRPVTDEAAENIEKLATYVPRLTEPEVRKVLSQFFTKEEIDSLGMEFIDNLKDGKGRKVWGAFVNDNGKRLFRFSTDVAQGTAEHETVHAFINMFVTDRQRTELVNFINEKYGEEVNEFAKTHGYNHLSSDMRAEEWLAEHFIDYVANKEIRNNRLWIKQFRIPKKMVDFFEKLYEKIKIFVGMEDKVTAFYNDIYYRNRTDYQLVNRRGGHDVRNIGLANKNVMYRNAEGISKEDIESIKSFFKNKKVRQYLSKDELLGAHIDYDNISDEDAWSALNKLSIIADYESKRARFGTTNADVKRKSQLKRELRSGLLKNVGERGGITKDIEQYYIGKDINTFLDDFIEDGYSPIDFAIITGEDGTIKRGRVGLGLDNDLIESEGEKLYLYTSDGSLPNSKSIESVLSTKTVHIVTPGGLLVELSKDNTATTKFFLHNTDKTQDSLGDSVTRLNTLINRGVGTVIDEGEFKGIKDGILTADEILSKGNEIERRIYQKQKEALESDGNISYRYADPTLNFYNNGGRRFTLEQVQEPRDITETDVISQILKNYEDAVAKNIKEGTLTVKKSQDLKQQAMFALNTAVEDLILPKYGDVLTSENKQILLGLGYGLKIATNKNDLLLLKEANKEILNQFNKGWSDLAKNITKSFSNIEELDKTLMKRGKVFVERNGSILSVDVHNELIDSIRSIPDGAGELTNLRTMTDNQLKLLSNKNAYVLLKLIDAVKLNINRGNFYTNLMMQLNPQLRNVRNGTNFFQAFAAVRVGDNTFVPRILQRNATGGYLGEGKGLSDAEDTAIKSNILTKIYDNYASKGKTMTSENLEQIVDDVLDDTNNGYKELYLNAFSPYANLVGIPTDVYAYLNKVFGAETANIKKLLNSTLGKDGNVDSMRGNILNMDVTLNDGSTVKVGDIIEGNADAEGWKQRLFGEMNKTKEGAIKGEYVNEFGVAPEERLQDILKGAHAWYNGIKFISENEAEMITSLFGNARKILQKDTNTNQFVEFDHTIGGQNDILRALIEDCAFNTYKIAGDDNLLKKGGKKFANGLLKVFGLNTRLKAFDAANWAKIQQAYEVYYATPLETLRRMPAPKDKISLTALELAKYFKTAETMLGSKDGARGVAMNSTTIDGHSINRAFGNIGTIIRNVNRPDGVYSLMNKIGNNQLIGMFRFAKEGDAAYHPILKRWGSNTTKASFLVNPGASGYQEYTKASKADTAREFNEIFGTNFDVNDTTIVLQALGGVKFISDSKYSKFLNDLMGNINNTLVLTRAVMSYPFQLFTIYPQLFAYSVKADGIKRGMGVENVESAREIRKKYGILEGTYVEFAIPENLSKWGKALYEKVLLHGDNPEIGKLGLEFDDGVLGLYGKVTDYSRKIKNPEQLSQLIDSTRDNANNIIDAAMAQTFKGLAFVKALQKNDFITFVNPKMFEEFMNNPTVSKEVKDKLLNRVDMYANRIFQDMLGIGFTGLDRVYTSGGVSDVLGAILSVINFKGAWGTNIVRQTGEKIWTMIKIAKLNGANIDDTVKQIMAMPEFTTFVESLFSDAVRMWRIGKYTDTGNWEDESEVDLIDFAYWALQNINTISQQWQGIMSFGPTRLVSGGVQGASAGIEYGDGIGGKTLDGTLGFMSGFFEAFAQNFGRNWKPQAVLSRALLIAVQNGSVSEGWNYLANEWYKVSGGTMRYLLEETENSYGTSTPLTVERGVVPSFVLGENFGGSDTAFSYKMRTLEQVEYLKDFFNWSNGNDDKLGDAKELFTTFLNNSQLFKTISNIALIPGTAIDYMANDGFLTWSKINNYNYNIRDIEDELIENSVTFKNFYESGKVVPPNNDAINDLLDKYMKPNYIGGYKAYQGIQNFLDYGHINGQKDSQGEDNGEYYDKPLEELYQRIEEDNPGALKQFMTLFNTVFLGDAESDEARKFTFSWFLIALNNYKNDPEYKKYVAAYNRGLLNYDYYNTLALVALDETQKRKAMGFSGGLEKVSSEDIKKLSGVINPINEWYLSVNLEDMYNADRGFMQNKMFSRVADEIGESLARKYFSREEETDWNGAKTGKEKRVLNSNLRNQIREDFEWRDLMNRGLYTDALTFTATLSKRVASSDKSGLIRAAMLDKYVQHIQNSDFAPEIKVSLIAQLLENNDDVTSYNSEFAEKYPGIYEEAKAYLNDLLHNISLEQIKNLNDIAILKDNLIDAFKDLSSSSSSSKNQALKGLTGDRGAAASAGLKSISSLAEKMAKLQSSDGKQHSIYRETSAKILPVAIKGVYPIAKESTAGNKIDFSKALSTRGYDPKTKTLGPVTPPKKNKAVKSTTRKLTQKEERELDLL